MHRLTLWLSGLLSSYYFPKISFSNMFEILLIAYLVYRLLLWIKQTRAWTLLKGLITIFICVFLVYLLNMDTLIYIVNRMFSVAIITAVVVFQPELRRALEQLGERSILAELLQLDNVVQQSGEVLFSDRTLEELVKACGEMAAVKTGALIVITQVETLEVYEKTGIRLDADVSSELLINIFEKNTPLHDGAVIIRGDRIVAATCYLPLSENTELNKALGTRHRAGVGISEVTDSMTIIVSEETGSISVAYKGKLERRVSAQRLTDRLTTLQNKTIKKKDKKLPFLLWKGRDGR